MSAHLQRHLGTRLGAPCLPAPHPCGCAGSILVNGNRSRLSYGRSAYVTQDEVCAGQGHLYRCLNLPHGARNCR